MNLLNETLSELRRKNLNPSDVEWVGSEDGDYAIDWAAFEKMANFDYDCGWGSQKVARDLVIVGSDWWLSRYEYDGSEGWAFHRKLERKPDAASFSSVNTADGSWSGCMIEDIEEELEEERRNPTGWNAIFHTHPTGDQA